MFKTCMKIQYIEHKLKNEPGFKTVHHGKGLDSFVSIIQNRPKIGDNFKHKNPPYTSDKVLLQYSFHARKKLFTKSHLWGVTGVQSVLL